MASAFPVSTADRPFAVDSHVRIVNVVDLPFPPSINRIWRASKIDRITKSVEYKEWQRRADVTVIAARTHLKTRIIIGSFEAYIIFDHKKRRGDLDNYVKVVLDWAQSRNMIANDKFCEKLTVEWGATDCAPKGCRLTLRELA